MKTEDSFWEEVERRITAGEKLDVHAFRCEYFTGKSMAEVTPEERRAAKQENYAEMYSFNWPLKEVVMTKNEPSYSAKEVAEMFGYKNANSLEACVHNGSFPPADFTGGFGGYTFAGGKSAPIKRLFWKRSTLEKEKRRRAALKGEQE